MPIAHKIFPFPLIMSLLAFVTVFTSCKQKNQSLPIERGKLIALMEDIYLAEAVADEADLSVRDSLRSLYMLEVSRHHGMTIEEILKTMEAVAEMTDTLYALQGIVMDSLRLKQLKITEKVNTGKLLTKK